MFFKVIRLASAGAPLWELPGDSLQASLIDIVCTWFPPHMLYGSLLLRQMGQGFLPSPQLQHLFLLSISAFITLGVSRAQFSAYHSLAFKL